MSSEEAGPSKSYLHVGIWAILTALSLSCGGQDLVEEGETVAEFGETTQSLYGGLQFTNCSVAEQTQLTDGIEWLRNRVGLQYKWCLQDAFAIEDRSFMIEEIYNRSRTPRGVNFSCGNNICTAPGIACAGSIGANDPEELEVESHWLSSTNSSAVIGSVILHEIMHNHTFRHLHGYDLNSIPDLAEDCARSYNSKHLTRSHLSDDVPLAHVGGSSGAQRESRCFTDTLATGIYGATGPELKHFGLRCQKETRGQLQGQRLITNGVEPPGSTSFIDNCSSGKVLVGLWGYADEHVNQVQPVCESLTTLETNASRFIGTLGQRHGTPGGNFYIRMCPNNKAVVGMRSNKSSRVNRIELICDDVRHLSYRYARRRGTAGGWGGSSFKRDCEGNGAMTGLYGHHDDQGNLGSVGGLCSPMTGRYPGFGHHSQYTPGVTGGDPEEGNGNDAWVHRCPSDEVMVGVRAVTRRTSGGSPTVLTASPLCVHWKRWRDGQTTPHTVNYDTAIGRRGNVRDMMCTNREVVVAIGGRSGDEINRIDVHCAEPEAGPDMLYGGFIGFGGGEPYFIRCPLSGPMTGLETGFDATTLRAYRAQCGRFNGTEIHPRNSPVTPMVGSWTLDFNADSCRKGEVMIGVRGHRGANRLTGLAPICQSLAQVRAHTLLERSWHTINGGTGITYQHNCPAGQYLIGLDGAASVSEFSRIGLWCGHPDVLIGDTVTGSLNATKPEARFRLHIPQDSLLQTEILLTGPSAANFDLYIRRGLQPDLTVYGQSSRSSNANESITLSSKERDFYYILVRAKSGSGNFSLNVRPKIFMPPLQKLPIRFRW